MGYKDAETRRAYAAAYYRRNKRRLNQHRRPVSRRDIHGASNDPPIDGQEARIALYRERAERGLPLFGA